MIDTFQDWLTEHAEARLLLSAYADREALLPKRSSRTEQAAVGTASPDSTSSVADAPVELTGGLMPDADDSDTLADPDTTSGPGQAEAWIPRLRHVEGLDDSILSSLHGGLIAHGYLKYELFVKQGGLRYRLTPEGRRAASEPFHQQAVRSGWDDEPAALPEMAA